MSSGLTEGSGAAARGGRARVAIFLRSLDGGGGAERMMVALARGIHGRGHAVDLVLGTARGAFLGEIPETVRVVELPRPSLARAMWQVGREDPEQARRLAPAFRNGVPHWVLGCIPGLVEYLQRERPDAMLSALNYSNIAALWARRIARVPTRLVVSERNTISRRASERRRNLRLPDLAGAFYPWADGIAAVSDGVAEDLAASSGIPRAAITTTYNPVVDETLRRLAAEPLEHSWFAEAKDVPVVLAAGKLRRQKGFDVLLDAFARLRAQRPARLVVLGRGERRPALRARARWRGIHRDVAFPGFVENPYRFMAAASLFVLSSRFEGLPGVLIQAMACGCPVVSTDCPSGPAEILDEDRLGPRVPVGDPVALAAAMERVLDAPPPAEMLVRSAARFSVERSVDRYLSLLLPG